MYTLPCLQYVLLFHLFSKKPELCVPLLAETSNPSLLPRVDVFMTVLRHLVPTGDVENVSKGKYLESYSKSTGP